MKNVNFTAGPETTGALDIRTAEAISVTAGAVFDPSCPTADTTTPWDIQRVRLVLQDHGIASPERARRVDGHGSRNCNGRMERGYVGWRTDQTATR